MGKELHCADLGMDCAGIVHGETAEEVMEGAVAHFRDVHNIDPVPPETAEQAMSLIRDV